MAKGAAFINRVRLRLRASAWLVLALLALAGLSQPAAAEPRRPGVACDTLPKEDLTALPDAPTQILRSALVPASPNVPAHCDVIGQIAPQVGFELRLPIAWNGKFLEIGCGALCGSLRFKSWIAWCEDGLRRGYACLTSDRGHSANEAGENAGNSALWAYNNLQAIVDYGFRAAHVAAVAGKAIVERHYGSAPRYSYFMGCSGGGRQGLTEAQKFPWDFDGIIAIAPGPGVCITHMTLLWNKLVTAGPDGASLFTDADIALLHRAVLNKCDALDGLKDGLIGDPRVCRFDPDQLICAEGQRGGCLTKVQVAAARKVYSGPTDSSGRRLNFGAMLGSEDGYMFFGSKYSEDFFKYMGFYPAPGASWKATDFNFDSDYKRLGLMETFYDASNPDLRRFKQAGGKLLVVQGWHDSGSSLPLTTIDYYEAVQRMGGAEQTRDFARLFMVPGMAHCVKGQGANAFDYLGALEAWVERRQAPERLIGYHVEGDDWGDYVKVPSSDRQQFSRPVYPYPLEARYDGQGDPADYRSFSPRMPASVEAAADSAREIP